MADYTAEDTALILWTELDIDWAYWTVWFTWKQKFQYLESYLSLSQAQINLIQQQSR